MTAITADLAGPLSLLNRDFQSRFLQSIEALTAIAASKGLERVKAWANADGSDAARLSAALILTDTAASCSSRMRRRSAEVMQANCDGSTFVSANCLTRRGDDGNSKPAPAPAKARATFPIKQCRSVWDGYAPPHGLCRTARSSLRLCPC